MQSLERSLRYLKRELSRSSPHGLLGWRYAMLQGNTQVQLHRHLWWSAPSHFPRLLWLFLEGWLWLRWILFGAWISTWQAVGENGPEVNRLEGLPINVQRWRVLKLTLAWCMPPDQIYEFRLYRDPSTALDYIFDVEMHAYHRSRSKQLGFGRTSLMLLQDKLVFTRKLESTGFPMVPILACIPRNSDQDIEHWLKDHCRIFCKTRSGSGAAGAFAAWMSHDGPRGSSMNGRPFLSRLEVTQGWTDLLAMDDALVQPLLSNHKAVASFCPSDKIATIRLISQKAGQEYRTLSAILEIPLSHDTKRAGLAHVFLPVDLSDGRLLSPPDCALISEEEKLHATKLLAMLPEAATLPGWEEISRYSHQAHALFPDIREIAWDWALTPDGPMLLEGNAGWGARTLQRLHGGLLNAT